MNPLEFALSRLTDDELSTTAAATYATTPPGLRAWIEHCVDMEQHRRRGIQLPIKPPEEAIPPEEEVGALAAAIALWEAEHSDAVRTLYAAMVKLLSAGPRH